MRWWIIGIGLAVGLGIGAGPAVSSLAADKEGTAKTQAAPVPEPRVFVTHHAGRFGGQAMKYTARAGETYLRDHDGKPVASIFSTAYVADKAPASGARPVTFIFNGGPGSASIWLHMGVFGPRIAQVPSDARDDGAPPYPIIDNRLSMLDLTDLVFIDPIGTGYSHVVGEGKTKDYWGTDEDARSIADFIRLWVTANKRWNAPKFIAGESFGTTRAATVSHALATGPADIAFNGLILISQALDYTGSTPSPDNLIAYVTYLPSLAAVAWYHHKIADAPDSLADWVAEARRFATDEYLPALFKGTRLEPEERTRLIARLAHFTGLAPDYIDRANLRVMTPRFRKQLLRDQGLSLGALDARYTGADGDDTAATPSGDAAGYGIGSAYAASLNHYFADELGIVMDRAYLASNPAVGKAWRYRTVPDGDYFEPHYVDVARRLATVMRRNADLKVMVASGYFDLITPFFDAEYTFGRHAIPMARVAMTYYPAGHMMYLHRPSFEKLVADMRAFITAALAAKR